MTSIARQRSDRLKFLLAAERHSSAESIAALCEFDRQELWKVLGYTGLWSYLRKELKMSDGAASYRKAAVKLSQKHPVVLDALRDGRLCVTVLLELSRVLESGRDADVISWFFELSKREAKLLADELCPRAAPVRDTVRVVQVTAAPQIPAPIYRVVHERDGGRCQAPLSSGDICGETRFLQVHHKVPVGKGGTTTVENLMLCCQGHNLLFAERDFGAEHMARFRG